MKCERRLARECARRLPPNMDPQQVCSWLKWLLFLLVMMCGITFLIRYCADYRDLFRYWGMREQTLRPEAIIPHFSRYLMPTVYAAATAAGLALALTAVLCSSYYQGSRSIYLMRRLPDGGRTLRRQIWSVPLLAAAAALLVGAALALLSWLVWRFVTPARCRPTPENIQRAMQAIAASPYSTYLS